MIVDSLEASLRYPMDFTFHIQNFSAIAYAKTVKPKQQATVAYSFIPADAFAGRPIGLTINLNYRDAAGNFFIDPVFNETVQIVEFDEGFDTETFFMYVCIFGATVLLLFLAFNFLSGKKGGSRPKPVETGTDDDGVDYEWIPKLAHVKGKLSVVLVLTQNKCTTSSDRDQDDQDLAMQQASTHFDYLKVNGHQIWISDFTFTLDIGTPNLVFRHVQQLIRFKFIRASNLMPSKILFTSQLSV